MATKIEWVQNPDGTAGETWNPTTGCTKVSPGCKNCYAERMANRLQKMGQPRYANGFKLTLHEDVIATPLRWKKPRMVFVDSMSDLFHADVPFEFIDKVFAVMALCPQHTFQVLTKRPERMAEYLRTVGQDCDDLASRDRGGLLAEWCFEHLTREQRRQLNKVSCDGWWEWQRMPNVWLGTSVENQQTADERIPHLLRCPASVRFLSCEPLLGPVDATRMPYKVGGCYYDAMVGRDWNTSEGYENTGGPSIDWVIGGAESGPGARITHPDWPRGLRDQCVAAGVPYFHKQNGEWAVVMESTDPLILGGKGKRFRVIDQFGSEGPWHDWKTGRYRFALMERVGKANAGRLLDGREWNEFPDPKKQTTEDAESAENSEPLIDADER